MKTTKTLAIMILALGLSVCPAKHGTAAPMGTSFTYQGRLMDANTPADGLYDFQFKLFDDPNIILGNQVGTTIDVNDLDVIDGYFTVELDFGNDVFDGNDCWLEVGVRPGDLDDPNEYTILLPRQEITPTPYAVYAERAGSVTGGVSGGGDSRWTLSGSNIYYNDGNVGIGSYNPTSRLDVTSSSSYPTVYGNNSGSGHGILGCSTSSTTAGVYGKNDNGYGVFGGSDNNIGVWGASENGIGVLGRSSTEDGYAGYFEGNGYFSGNVGIGTMSPGYELHVVGKCISGVDCNATGDYATVSGGFQNEATGDNATVSGGVLNDATGDYATVSGGYDNAASGERATISGGMWNEATGDHASVSGGRNNEASGEFATVSGGYDNTASDEYATVSGGYNNTASGEFATVSGGMWNDATGDHATVSGGKSNDATGDYATVSGGRSNIASGFDATVSGGLQNLASGEYSFAAGCVAQAMHRGAFVWADSTYTTSLAFSSTGRDQFLIRASGGVGIGTNNPGGYQLAVNGSAAKTAGGSWSSLSDARLKEIGHDYERGLSEIGRLNPVRYRYAQDNDLELPTDDEYVGLVAQEVQGVIPEAVEENTDGYLMVNNDPVIWAMVNAIKELKAENDSLKQRLEALESTMDQHKLAVAKEVQQ